MDGKDQIVVTYHKHDEKGNTQAYAARFAGDAWSVKPVSDWEGKHIFKGGGSGPSTYGTYIGLGTPKVHTEGTMAISFRHWSAGKGLLVFKEDTLERVGVEPQREAKEKYPAPLRNVQSDFAGMGVRWRGDSGTSPDPNAYYALRWETLGSHRDRPRPKPWPEDSELVLYKFVDDE